MHKQKNRFKSNMHNNLPLLLLAIVNFGILLFYVSLIVIKNQSAISKGTIEPLAAGVLLGIPITSYLALIVIAFVKIRFNHSAHFDQAPLIAGHVTHLSFLLFLIYCYFAIPVI